ncbi:MAG: S9 family peptidase, partial [Henriciella sp.]
MKLNWTIALAASLGAACTQTPADTPASETVVSTAPPVETVPVALSVTEYPASLFHETTSYRLGSSSGHIFSPGGDTILASTDASGIFNAVTLDATGDMTPLTSSDDNAIYAQSFFPDDSRVIVTSDGGGNEIFHVYVREADGTLTDLTPGEEVRASFLGWRDDGAVFYVATNERDPETND